MRGKLPQPPRDAHAARVKIVPVLNLEDAAPQPVCIRPGATAANAEVVRYRHGCVCVALACDPANARPLDRRQKPLGDYSRVYRLTHDEADFCRKALAEPALP